jgi:acyl-CoA synthetase (AMP-forming)/AMP-acid ligase II
MLRELFDSVVSRQPQTLALIEGETRVCYADLMSRSGRFARYLVEEVGLRRGDHIAVCLPSCWEVVAGFLAASGIGAVWVPFHPQWRSREVAWLAGRVPLRALITNSLLQQTWRDAAVLPPGVVLIDDPAIQDRLLASASPLPASPSMEDEVSVCFTTSGSTGRPRVALRTQANLLAAQRSTAAALGVKPGMRILSAVPFHYSGGFDNCMLLPLLFGATAVVLPSFTPAAAEAAVAQERVQLVMGSPFIYSMLLESNANRASFASVETAISFGAPMAPDLARRSEERLGLRVRQLYGATETGVIAIQSPDTPFQDGVAGQTVASAEVHILDERGERLGPGYNGDVVVGGPGVMTGYLNEPDLNRELFRDGLFRTGDLGRLDASGTLILCGRSKTVLNLGGTKVDPAEIERVLLEMPEVRDCTVRGVRDTRQGEIVAATIGVRPGLTLSRQAVVAHCRRRLAEFKVPRRIEFVDAVAVEVSGKKPKAWGTETDESHSKGNENAAEDDAQRVN